MRELADPVRVPRPEPVFVTRLPESFAAELAERLEEPPPVTVVSLSVA